MPGVNKEQESNLCNAGAGIIGNHTVEPQEERELTQTDRINRLLLLALLQNLNRLNVYGVEPPSSSETDAEWSDHEDQNEEPSRQ